MKLLFVADGRSPTARNWIRYFCEQGDHVVLVTTFACDPIEGVAAKYDLPVAFSSVKKPSGASNNPLFGAATLKLRTVIRQWLGPRSVARAGRILRNIIQSEKPDLIHAMRIPFEGMVAADAYDGTPLVISVWGNDFTLHANANSSMMHYTKWAMQVADALHTDCHRDVRLASEFGYDANKPTLVIPGSGGVRNSIFYPITKPPSEKLIVNPRGFRVYIQNASFFTAIPMVLEKMPSARFVCPGMRGEPQVERWIDELGIGHAVELLPALPQDALADVYRRSQIVVSPSTHDGTPNSLIEAMACGCYPVAGDIESIREWIEDGKNGSLVDATNPTQIAEAIIHGLMDEPLRTRAREANIDLIKQKAEYSQGMAQARAFYEQVMRNTI